MKTTPKTLFHLPNKPNPMIQKVISIFLLNLFFLTGYINAQKIGKLGHVNYAEVISLMPEKKTASTKLDSTTKDLEKQLQEMISELRAKEDKYASESSKLPDLVKADREAEVQNLYKRIQEYQQKAQEVIQKKEQELMEPLLKKGKKAIEQVAKENGYSYIFDTSSGILLFYEESDNVLALVKKKLNLP